MSREAALTRQKRGLREWIGAVLGGASPGAERFSEDGITAAIVPACPQRSLANSVTFEDAAELEVALDGLDRRYRDAGIAAWTVWAPEFDAAAIGVLEAAGHKLDGSPMAMSASLADFVDAEPGDLQWDMDVEPAELGRLNDIAYGLEPDVGIGAAMAEPPPAMRLYQARVDGQPACVLGTMDHGSDLGIYNVATHPDHRGIGLASRLMTVAIREARERGLETTSLQGSAMGSPVYERLGYANDFTLTMWERRRPA
jgi:GNAT superfamily N-acetyltransferase